ncbi:hypothetical protein JTE90_007439 [Oedothorax gibbosus]|uniref:Uncharacterized protein n=1 Tax=Oedothorax gibbosus TaxID=931172 RepID=A0AAV6UQZ5_9ARAC|nr:hypothetical protein JTE90_007439 [Oedothorax gibbosus]
MVTPKCALCKGPHTANYRQYPKRPLTASQREHNDITPQLPLPPATIPPPAASNQSPTQSATQNVPPPPPAPQNVPSTRQIQEPPLANPPPPHHPGTLGEVLPLSHDKFP